MAGSGTCWERGEKKKKILPNAPDEERKIQSGEKRTIVSRIAPRKRGKKKKKVTSHELEIS